MAMLRRWMQGVGRDFVRNPILMLALTLVLAQVLVVSLFVGNRAISFQERSRLRRVPLHELSI